MGPAAEADLVQIISDLWKQRATRRLVLSGGSMGATSALTFAALHPNLVDGVAALGRSNAVIQLDAKGQYTVFVGVTDIGAGAKTTMAMIAAEALGVAVSKVKVVWGDTDRCPYSVGESGSRTTIMTGYAVVEAARDLRKQIAEKGMPAGDAILTASATPSPTSDGKVRNVFGAHFVEVEVDAELQELPPALGPRTVSSVYWTAGMYFCRSR